MGAFHAARARACGRHMQAAAGLEPCQPEGRAQARAVRRFRALRSAASSTHSDRHSLDERVVLDGADVMLVHEWTASSVMRRIARHRRDGGRDRLFHNTHHCPASERGLLFARNLTTSSEPGSDMRWPSHHAFAPASLKRLTDWTRLVAWTCSDCAAAAASSTSAAFCCVVWSIWLMAWLTCSMPVLCS